jgi:hypothetical protein
LTFVDIFRSIFSRGKLGSRIHFAGAFSRESRQQPRSKSASALSIAISGMEDSKRVNLVRALFVSPPRRSNSLWHRIALLVLAQDIFMRRTRKGVQAWMGWVCRTTKLTSGKRPNVPHSTFAALLIVGGDCSGYCSGCRFRQRCTGWTLWAVTPCKDARNESDTNPHKWPGEVCKTFMRRFDPDPRLQTHPLLETTLRNFGSFIVLVLC